VQWDTLKWLKLWIYQIPENSGETRVSGGGFRREEQREEE